MEEVLEPIKEYSNKYKQLHYENVVSYFDELVKKSKVNIEENKDTVKRFHQQEEKALNIDKQISALKTKKYLLIVASIFIGIVLFILGIYFYTTMLWLSIVLWILLIGVIIASIIVVKKKFNAQINNAKTLLNEEKKKADELKKIAWQQVAPLNALFDWNTPGRILNKTIPLLQMDENFDEQRFTLLHERYGLQDNYEKNISTYYVQSGSILGNPFVICTDHVQYWGSKVYMGSLVINWSEHIKTDKGWETVYHTETLTATVTKDIPKYYYDTYLIYANEVAPDLSFSRSPNNGSSLDDEKLRKYVQKEIKKLDKQSEKDIKHGGDFTRVGNDTFDVLFGANDRDNEVQFRLMYTPLAQKNIVALLRSKEGYGDDFTQKKRKKINIVRSEHSQNFDYYASPMNYIDFDYEVIREKFISYNAKYFKGLFFDLAPLLSVPSYQQQKSKEFIYGKPYSKNLSTYEHESIANSFDKDLVTPHDADTPCILKTNFKSKDNDLDVVEIVAHAFKGIRRLALVPVHGGDGRLHDVPVYYVEYLPVSKTTNAVMEKKNISRNLYNTTKSTRDFKDRLNMFSSPSNALYERGIFAAITKNYEKSKVDNFNKLFKTNEKNDSYSSNINMQDLASKIFDEQNEIKNLESKNIDFDKSDEIVKQDA